MLNKQTFSTDVHKAELIENEVRKVCGNEVLAKMEYTVVIESSVNAPQIYNELCDDKNFPIGTVFDWRDI